MYGWCLQDCDGRGGLGRPPVMASLVGPHCPSGEAF